MRRIVVIRTSALGDTVLATPVLRALRARWPQAEIHFVTHAAFAPLFEGLQEITRVWRWDPRGRHVGMRGFARFASELEAVGPFDLGIDLQNKLRTRLLLGRLHPVRRYVFVKREGLAASLRSLAGDDPVLDRGPAAALYLEALPGLDLPPVDLRPMIHVPRPAAAAADRLLAGAEGAPVVALAPGARWAVKRWPAERFAEVGDALSAQGAKVVLAGGPGDVEALESVRASMKASPIGDTAGLDVAGLAAVLARSAVLVTADSAPSHLAQAVGTPVVAVFGPTSARRWGPLPGAGTAISLPIACAPCSNHGKRGCPLGHHACLADLPSEPVAEAAIAALRAGREQGAAAAEEAAARWLVPLAALVARGPTERAG